MDRIPAPTFGITPVVAPAVPRTMSRSMLTMLRWKSAPSWLVIRFMVVPFAKPPTEAWFLVASGVNEEFPNRIRVIAHDPECFVARSAQQRADSSGFVVVVDVENGVDSLAGRWSLARRARAALLGEHAFVVGNGDSVFSSEPVLPSHG